MNKPTFPIFRSRCGVAALVLAGFAGPALAAAPAVVTSDADSGEGSLRAALESGAREIVIATDSDVIMTGSPLTYSGEKPLAIYGTGQTVMATGDFNILEVTEGANLTVVGVNFEGVGGFSIESQGTGKGIFVDLRDNQNGQLKVVLKDVKVSEVANHGVHVSDCDLADDCGGGGGGAGGGSSASIIVELTNVTIENAGTGKFDADGVRVDERANGSIHFRADGSVFTGVGADGVELDEGQNGGVFATVTNSQFSHNGSYCDPVLLADFLPDPDEREDIPEGEVSEDDITPTGTPDDRCFEVEFETHGDGSISEYEVALDLDDGFDIDEAGNGGLVARVFNSQVMDNDDEGLDFDEEDNGKIDLLAVGVEASGNTDDGIKLSEEDSGDVYVLQLAVTAEDNGGKGFVFEEAGQGDLDALVEDSGTAGNDDGDVGIEAVQEDQGSGRLVLRDTDVGETEEGDDFPVPGVEAVGVDVIEE
jgi:hypothetical protein